ncbi:unnamed protein product [Amoebophrya sp. A25]|nr:unnamed protein product [Amoebophrya sp. A25]|eukprot:GSA25T00005564001.1
MSSQTTMALGRLLMKTARRGTATTSATARQIKINLVQQKCSFSRSSGLSRRKQSGGQHIHRLRAFSSAASSSMEEAPEKTPLPLDHTTKLMAARTATVPETPSVPPSSLEDKSTEGLGLEENKSTLADHVKMTSTKEGCGLEADNINSADQDTQRSRSNLAQEELGPLGRGYFPVASASSDEDIETEMKSQARAVVVDLPVEQNGIVEGKDISASSADIKNSERGEESAGPETASSKQVPVAGKRYKGKSAYVDFRNRCGFIKLSEPLAGPGLNDGKEGGTQVFFPFARLADKRLPRRDDELTFKLHIIQGKFQAIQIKGATGREYILDNEENSRRLRERNLHGRGSRFQQEQPLQQKRRIALPNIPEYSNQPRFGSPPGGSTQRSVSQQSAVAVDSTSLTSPAVNDVKPPSSVVPNVRSISTSDPTASMNAKSPTNDPIASMTSRLLALELSQERKQVAMERRIQDSVNGMTSAFAKEMVTLKNDIQYAPAVQVLSEKVDVLTNCVSREVAGIIAERELKADKAMQELAAKVDDISKAVVAIQNEQGRKSASMDSVLQKYTDSVALLGPALASIQATLAVRGMPQTASHVPEQGVTSRHTTLDHTQSDLQRSARNANLLERIRGKISTAA